MVLADYQILIVLAFPGGCRVGPRIDVDLYCFVDLHIVLDKDLSASNTHCARGNWIHRQNQASACSAHRRMFSTFGGVQCIRGIIMSTSGGGDILSTSRDVQYIGGGSMIYMKDIMNPCDVLNIPRWTQDIPRCTHDIHKFTEHTLYQVKQVCFGIVRHYYSDAFP